MRLKDLLICEASERAEIIITRLKYKLKFTYLLARLIFKLKLIWKISKSKNN